MESLYIIIPAYNEEANIEKVITDWYKIIEKMNEKSRLVVINDGSKDLTFEKMKKMEERYSRFIPITKQNEGHGATVLFGYNYALQNGADYIFQTDSDGQTSPDEFWKFWEERKKYDMVIGYRKNRQDGISRIFVTKILKLALLLCFHKNIKDANTPFRLLNAKTLNKYISLIPEKHNLSNVLLSVIYAKKNLAVKYETITFKPRQGGKNSINLNKISKIGIKALTDFKHFNKKLSRRAV